MDYRSWGYAPPEKPNALRPTWSTSEFESLAGGASSILAFGNGRSYGDSCLNSQGCLIDMRSLDRLVSFDRERGVLTAQAGISLASILSVIVPAGWFLPVTPGTSFVTLGGAIANDVHGKNHHRDGTFGRFVKSFSLLRSEGGVFECSSATNVELFSATIGGLGLTGLIMQASIQLIPIKGTSLDVRLDAFTGLDEFVALSNANSETHRYSVAWLDCVARGKQFARGILLSANHEESDDQRVSLSETLTLAPKLQIPINMPSWLLNRHTVSAFNTLYYQRHRKLHAREVSQHYSKFFYPLDSIGRWNRIYGSKGFHQYQFVVPLDAQDVMQEILERIVRAGLGSFLAVLKLFGDLPSPGLLSFPREGICLALDFANRGERTEALIRSIDELVRDAGGAAYPAKDRLMSEQSFNSYYPAWEHFSTQVDPAFQSDFWQRVHG